MKKALILTLVVFMALALVTSCKKGAGSNVFSEPAKPQAGSPVTITYKAGISHEKRLLKTRLDQLLSTAAKEEEQFLGLIYIGR